MIVYEEWLGTASERELFIFVESLRNGYIEEEGRLSRQYEKDMQRNMDYAHENLSRFGVVNVNEWYRKNLLGWQRDLTNSEYCDWLRRMPWNL